MFTSFQYLYLYVSYLRGYTLMVINHFKKYYLIYSVKCINPYTIKIPYIKTIHYLYKHQFNKTVIITVRYLSFTSI